jgi:glycosyltransferase involved in cell wall biosynthesis
MEGVTDLFPYSVVVPTMNRVRIVLETAERLLEQDFLPERVIIVDASVPGLVVPEALEARYRAAGVALEVVHALPSTSAQRNRGADRVETPLVLFTDDDVVLPGDYASSLIGRWSTLGLDHIGAVSGEPEDLPIVGSAAGRLAGRLYRRAFMLHDARDGFPGIGLRKSQKLRYGTRPMGDTYVPVVSSQAVIYRTDLARKHRFDEKFTGYVLGEDHDLAARVARERPILLATDVKFVHTRQPGARGSSDRWYNVGRSEAYFRLRRLERSPTARTAFALSIIGEAAGPILDSVRERNLHHITGYVRGLAETLRDIRHEREVH